MKKNILKTMISILAAKCNNYRDKNVTDAKEYIYAMDLFEEKKYLESYCYVLSNIDKKHVKDITINDKNVAKIFKRVNQLKDKLYSNEEIASIVSNEFSK